MKEVHYVSFCFCVSLQTENIRSLPHLNCPAVRQCVNRARSSPCCFTAASVQLLLVPALKQDNRQESLQSHQTAYIFNAVEACIHLLSTFCPPKLKHDCYQSFVTEPTIVYHFAFDRHCFLGIMQV